MSPKFPSSAQRFLSDWRWWLCFLQLTHCLPWRPRWAAPTLKVQNQTRDPAPQKTASPTFPQLDQQKYFRAPVVQHRNPGVTPGFPGSHMHFPDPRGTLTPLSSKCTPILNSFSHCYWSEPPITPWVTPEIHPAPDIHLEILSVTKAGATLYSRPSQAFHLL